MKATLRFRNLIVTFLVSWQTFQRWIDWTRSRHLQTKQASDLDCVHAKDPRMVRDDPELRAGQIEFELQVVSSVEWSHRS